MLRKLEKKAEQKKTHMQTQTLTASPPSCNISSRRLHGSFLSLIYIYVYMYINIICIYIRFTRLKIIFQKGFLTVGDNSRRIKIPIEGTF